MISAVIGEMMQNLPPVVAMLITFEIAIIEETGRILRLEVVDVMVQVAPHLHRTFPQHRKFRKFLRFGQARRNAAVKSLQPDPLRADNVSESAPHGWEARSHVSQELFVR